MSTRASEKGEALLSSDGRVLSLRGRLDFGNAPDVYREFVRQFDNRVEEIDCSELEHADSTALALLLIGTGEAARQQRNIQISGLNPRLRSLAEVYGIDQMLALKYEGHS